MKTIKNIALALIGLLLLAINVYGQEGQPPREKWSLVAMEGTVTEIVKETRDITLMGPNGDLVTITAGEAV